MGPFRNVIFMERCRKQPWAEVVPQGTFTLPANPANNFVSCETSVSHGSVPGDPFLLESKTVPLGG